MDRKKVFKNESAYDNKMSDISSNMRIRFKDFRNQNSFEANVTATEYVHKEDILKIIEPSGSLKYFFEWTDFTDKIKPYYDIDMWTTEPNWRELIDPSKEKYLNLFTELYPESEIAISQSHGAKVKKGVKGYAISFHFVINGYETTHQDLKAFNISHDIYSDKNIDKGVYRNGGNMRALYSNKPGDKRSKIPTTMKNDSFAHLITSTHLTSSGSRELISPCVSPPDSPKSVKEEETAAPDEEEWVIDDFKKENTYSKDELDKIISVIKTVKDITHEYSEWIAVGMALHNITSGDVYGLELFCTLSNDYMKENPNDDCDPEAKWKSFGNDAIKFKLGLTSIRKLYEKYKPEDLKTSEGVFRHSQNNDDPIHISLDKVLLDLNDRLIYIKSTSEFITLDKKKYYTYDKAGLIVGDEWRDCWSLKKVQSVATHFEKQNFYYEVDGKRKLYNPFKEWRSWSDRREVWAIGFDPRSKENSDIFNLWNGFAISKEQADATDEKEAQPILDHILELWCDGDSESYNYVLDMFAHYIQKPHIKTGVVLSLKSKQGGGKGIILNKLNDIIGDDHFCSNSNANYLFGDFNGQLEGKILVNLDEAFWGGDKKMEGMMKSKITETKQTVRKLFKEAYTVDDYVNYIITTNNDWFAGVTEDDRRYYCLELVNKLSGRMTKKTVQEVKPVLEASSESFAKVLYNRDISNFNPRVFNKTKLLQTQVELNWSSTKVWFHNVLKDAGFTIKNGKDTVFVEWGELPEGGHFSDKQYIGGVKKKNKKTKETKTMYFKEWIYSAYECQLSDGRKVSESAFFRELMKFFDLEEIRIITEDHQRRRVFILPELDAARERWNKEQEYIYKYDEGDDWE